MAAETVVSDIRFDHVSAKWAVFRSAKMEWDSHAHLAKLVNKIFFSIVPLRSLHSGTASLGGTFCNIENPSHALSIFPHYNAYLKHFTHNFCKYVGFSSFSSLTFMFTYAVYKMAPAVPGRLKNSIN